MVYLLQRKRETTTAELQNFRTKLELKYKTPGLRFCLTLWRRVYVHGLKGPA